MPTTPLKSTSSVAKPRRPFDALDRLLDKAFAQRDTPTSTPVLRPHIPAQQPPSLTDVQQTSSSRAKARRPRKHPSSASFKESADGRTVTATFDVPGVRKEDMHVSYCGRHLVVSWRTSRVTERREGDVLVREREVVGNNQIISLADGTQFADIWALKDSKRLALTYPNPRRAPRNAPRPKTAMSGITEYHSCVPADDSTIV